jgi:outer membrane immunogenic protein
VEPQLDQFFDDGSNHWDIFLANGTIPASLQISADRGFIGGLQFGYNFQSGPIVFGVETDISYSTLHGSAALPGTTFVGGNFVQTFYSQSDQKLKSFGTLRGRLGFTPIDRALVYVTGGLAYGDASSSFAMTHSEFLNGVGNISHCGPAIFNPVGTPCASGSVSKSLVGWTIGAGWEYAVTNPTSAV